MPDDINMVRFHETGTADVLSLEHHPQPVPAAGEVRLRVKAIGINRADIMFRSGAYLVPPDLPSMIGFEAAGVVEAIGPGVDEQWLGKTVSSIPTFWPNDYGVYAEATILPIESLALYPEHLSFVEGVAIWTPYLTAYGGLVHFGRLKAGDHVLITAASSSVGLAAIQTVKAENGIAIATTRNPAKRDVLLELGADHVIVTTGDDLIRQVMHITHQRGVQIVFDPIGGAFLETLVDAAGTRGTVIEYGLLADEPTPFPLFEALSKYLSFKAFDVHEIYEHQKWFAAGRDYVSKRLLTGAFHPRIDRVFALEQVVDAHRYVESNQHIGRVVLDVN